MKRFNPCKITPLLIAAAAAALGACSDNDDFAPESHINADNDAITYAVTTNNASRATIYDATNTVPAFYASACYLTSSGDYISYFRDEAVSVSGNAGKGSHYWPSMELHFIASNQSDLQWTDDDGLFHPHYHYTLDTTNGGTDFVYAIKTHQTKEKNAAGGVALNFRHALAQVTVQAEVKGSLVVAIDSIIINEIYSKGKYFLTDFQESTDALTGDSTKEVEEIQHGYWMENSGLTSFKYAFPDGTVLHTANAKVAATGQVFHIPHDYTENEWDVTDDDSPVEDEHEHDVYATVYCKIYRDADAYDDGNGTPMDTDDHKFMLDSANGVYGLKAPIRIYWEGGRHYTYTLVFADTNLIVNGNIAFNVSVTDWSSNVGNYYITN